MADKKKVPQSIKPKKEKKAGNELSRIGLDPIVTVGPLELSNESRPNRVTYANQAGMSIGPATMISRENEYSGPPADMGYQEEYDLLEDTGAAQDEIGYQSRYNPGMNTGQPLAVAAQGKVLSQKRDEILSMIAQLNQKLSVIDEMIVGMPAPEGGLVPGVNPQPIPDR